MWRILRDETAQLSVVEEGLFSEFIIKGVTDFTCCTTTLHSILAWRLIALDWNWKLSATQRSLAAPHLHTTDLQSINITLGKWIITKRSPHSRPERTLRSISVRVTDNYHAILLDFKQNILQGCNLCVMPAPCLQLENEAVWKGELGIVGERVANESLPVWRSSHNSSADCAASPGVPPGNNSPRFQALKSFLTDSSGLREQALHCKSIWSTGPGQAALSAC